MHLFLCKSSQSAPQISAKCNIKARNLPDFIKVTFKSICPVNKSNHHLVSAFSNAAGCSV